VLTGGGSDILKGGIGNDTYVYHSGDGFDTIEDIDGTNKITVDGIDLSLSGGNKYGIDVWLSADKKCQFVLSPANSLGQRGLTVTNTSETAGKVSLKITNFHNGDFGLFLPQNPSVYIALVPTQEILGDLAPKDFNAAQPGIQTQTDSLGNIITLPGTPEPSRVDALYGSALGDHIAGKLGADILDGKGSDDQMEGGGGRDNLVGGVGKDTLFGGDPVNLSAITDFSNYGGITAGSYGDFLSGGADIDALIGSAQSDALMGGDGDDLLVGGVGHDVIFGDSTYDATSNDWTLRSLPQAYEA
jgi:Ca2+-binding RTX toxin-like protein